MKKNYLVPLLAACLGGLISTAQTPQQTLTIFDKIVFYDGYAATTEDATPVDVLKISNSLYAKKMTIQERQAILSTLEVEVTIGALCDNYDRLGGVFLSLVPQGADLTEENKQTLELGRFITPFMNKNKQPTEVPYVFDLAHLVPLFKDGAYDSHDFWIEFNVFGVPYAANNEVAGCAGRNDVFEGTLKIKTEDTGEVPNTFYLQTLASRASLNNYNATDVEGTTTKLLQFTLEEDIPEVTFHLITSNHGANSGGEEYVRRTHQVFLDGDLLEAYKPGGKSCEPYRMYNTQGNGIYGPRPKSAADWTSWNNWCPGDVIPNRLLTVVDVKRGTHELKITVPDARFQDGQGDFPLSLFFFATGFNGVLSTEDFQQVEYRIYPNPVTDYLYIQAEQDIQEAVLYDMKGSSVLEVKQETKIPMETLASGSYWLHLTFANGVKTAEKIVKK